MMGKRKGRDNASFLTKTEREYYLLKEFVDLNSSYLDILMESINMVLQKETA